MYMCAYFFIIKVNRNEFYIFIINNYFNLKKILNFKNGQIEKINLKK